MLKFHLESPPISKAELEKETQKQILHNKEVVRRITEMAKGDIDSFIKNRLLATMDSTVADLVAKDILDKSLILAASSQRGGFFDASTPVEIATGIMEPGSPKPEIKKFNLGMPDRFGAFLERALFDTTGNSVAGADFQFEKLISGVENAFTDMIDDINQELPSTGQRGIGGIEIKAKKSGGHDLKVGTKTIYGGYVKGTETDSVINELVALKVLHKMAHLLLFTAVFLRSPSKRTYLDSATLYTDIKHDMVRKGIASKIIKWKLSPSTIDSPNMRETTDLGGTSWPVQKIIITINMGQLSERIASLAQNLIDLYSSHISIWETPEQIQGFFDSLYDNF